jgi:hypothetical protein
MPSPSPSLASAALAAALLGAAAGCTVRDEQATNSGDGRWWATAPSRPTSGLIGGGAVAPLATPAIDYVDGYETGSRRAMESGLPMLVVFRAAWCRWSGELVQAAVADPRVVRLSRRFICMAVDADRHADACRQFGVQAFPTVIILDATGTERFRATGSAASVHIATAMSEALTDQPRPRRIAAEPSGPAR